ncbi:unnamed protein product [Effrenium voratum]|uniref:Dipeptidase n=1 Tax=Effrenium voratum TaxID=2562239 RepID=A0AA36JET0_9DINO|nr:unnamed protein product [Effrenium voratum]
MGVPAVALAGLLRLAHGCTNLIVTPGASADGSVIFSYTADSGDLYGTLGHYPAGKHQPGETRAIWNWDTGKYLGAIDEAPYTYNVIGNLNEHGLAIGETTFGGNETLGGGEGIMDYGSLIWVTLQRCKTAREAILMFDELVSKYGYVSDGESFTIADTSEVWVMELIGKGRFEKGAVWVAIRIPDGHVSGHANQARIQKFPLRDAENCVYSSDVISFAVKVGLWDSQRPEEEFSFADCYDPISFTGARLSDARVWSFLSSAAADPGFGKTYEEYVLGHNVTASARMPLSIPAGSKISALDLMSHMRNHYEGTVLDSRHDVGAGASGSPFRVRPLVWKAGGSSYVHEREVGTPQAGWNFVAQLRPRLPRAMAGLLWFAPDDATFSVHAPFHGGTTRVPHGYADGTGDALHFSQESAFWAFNSVANFLYPRPGGEAWVQLAGDVLFNASAETDSVDVFIGHSWSAGRWEKFLAVCLFFNLDLAVRWSLGTCLVAAAILLARAREGMTGLGGSPLALPCLVYLPITVFFVVFFCGQHLRGLPLLGCFGVGGQRSTSVWLDKLCIHQTNMDLKAEQIAALPVFVARSSRMLVLWDETYFERLWCNLELATFARHGGAEKVELLPLWLAPWLLASILSDLLSVTILEVLVHVFPNWSVGPDAIMDIARSVLGHNPALLKFVAWFVIWMISSIVYLPASIPSFFSFRMKLRNHQLLLDQMADFDVRKAKCTVPSDRNAIEQQVKELFKEDHRPMSWLPPEGVDEGEVSVNNRLSQLWLDPLDSFNAYVRGALRENVIRQIGKEPGSVLDPEKHGVHPTRAPNTD